MSYDNDSRKIIVENDASGMDILGDMGIEFTRIWSELATQPNAPHQIVHDWNVLQLWLGCAGRELSRDDHKKIADAFHAYLGKGVSPTRELESSFRYFEKLAQTDTDRRPHAPVPLEVEEVFGRMLGAAGRLPNNEHIGPKGAEQMAPANKNAHKNATFIETKFASLNTPSKRIAFLFFILGLGIFGMTFAIFNLQEGVSFFDGIFRYTYRFWIYRIFMMLGLVLAAGGYLCAFHYERTIGRLALWINTGRLH